MENHSIIYSLIYNKLPPLPAEIYNKYSLKKVATVIHLSESIDTANCSSLSLWNGENLEDIKILSCKVLLQLIKMILY